MFDKSNTWRETIKLSQASCLDIAGMLSMDIVWTETLCEAKTGTVKTRTWLKDDHPLQSSSHLMFSEDRSSLMFVPLKKEDNREHTRLWLIGCQSVRTVTVTSPSSLSDCPPVDLTDLHLSLSVVWRHLVAVVTMTGAKEEVHFKRRLMVVSWVKKPTWPSCNLNYIVGIATIKTKVIKFWGSPYFKPYPSSLPKVKHDNQTIGDSPMEDTHTFTVIIFIKFI